MKEYKIVKRESMWSTKDDDFIDLFNQNAREGWEVLSVGFNQSGMMLKAVMVRDKNR